MSWRTGFGVALLMALASGCGSTTDERVFDEDTVAEEATSDGSTAPRLDGYEWSFSSAVITMLPDVDPSMNGNLAADVDATLVEMEVTLAARPDAAAEDDEVPITDASVRIGSGHSGATADGDFDWIDLVHQGSGVYTAATIGVADVYRVEIEGSAIGNRTASIESIPSGRILTPVNGETHSGSASLPLGFEPIVSGIWAARHVDGKMHGPATSRTSEQEELSIASTWLDAGSDPVIGLHRFRAAYSVGSAGQHDVVFGEMRTVTIHVQ